MTTEKQALPTQLESEVQELWKRIKKPKDKALIKLLFLLGKSSESLPLEELEVMLAESDTQPAKAKKQVLPPILTDEEIEALWQYIKNPRDKGLFGLLLLAGRRANEAATFEVDGIDLENHLIRGIGKFDKPYELPIIPDLEDILKECLDARPPQASHPYLLWRLDAPSKPLNRNGVWVIVSRIGWKALRRAIWPHLLRHTYATRLYRKTGDIAAVAQALQHERIGTADIYAHPDLEDLRRAVATTDERSFLKRFWDGLKPRTIPDLLKPKYTPLFIGEVIGREQELAKMRRALQANQHCLAFGDLGVGRKILLKILYNEQKARPGHVYEMDGLKPSRNALQGLYEAMEEDGLPVGELPSDTRPAKVYMDAIKRAAKGEQITLFIYNLDDFSGKEFSDLQDLAKHCIVFAATTPDAKEKVRDALFSCHETKIDPLKPPAVFTFIDKVMDEESISVPDRKSYHTHIKSLSGGNARGIIELVRETKQTGDAEPENFDTRKVLPATPILTTIWTAVVLSRYSASALSEPQWKVWATVILFGLMPLILLDKLLKMRRAARRKKQ